LLEGNLQTSSETSKVQNHQLKKMADGRKPQKGGKRKEEHTAFEILDDLYAGYCTPDEETHGKETKEQHKMRMQKIKRYCTYQWRRYNYVTSKYMKDFAINPPCNRPPLAPGQTADPTSIRRGEEFPKEWAKHQPNCRNRLKRLLKNSTGPQRLHKKRVHTQVAEHPRKL
jgi:hypothetical protein